MNIYIYKNYNSLQTSVFSAFICKSFKKLRHRRGVEVEQASIAFMNVDNVSESRISAGSEFHSLAPS